MMLSRKVGSAYETIAKKRRRDGLRRLIEAGVITACLEVTSPLPHIAIERLCDSSIRVAGRSEIRQSERITTYEYADPKPTKFEPPESPDPLPHTVDATLGTIEWDQPFVAVVPNGKLIGHTAVGYSDADGVLLETTISQRRILERDLVKHPLSVARLLAYERGVTRDTAPEFDEIVPLVNLYSNYYHWVQNTLPRLQGVREYERQVGTEPKLLIRPDPPSWIKESLELFGFGTDRWIEWDRKAATAERMVIPSFRRLEFRHPARQHTHLGVDFRNLAVPRDACEWLRETATKRISTSNFEQKVYISRADAHKRQIENEDRLMEMLSARGFERYVLSELSFPEQVELFANADTIIAPHGAGLVNMLFAEDCRVIELAPEPIRPTFFMLAETMEFDYSFIHCETVGRNIAVDLEKLRPVLLEDGPES